MNPVILLFAGLGAVFSAAPAHANSEMDRQFALRTIGFIRSWDNVDGLFSDYIANAYKDYFATQSRFVLQDLSKADSVIQHSKLPYRKVIEDPEILGQVARATRTESLIRTRVVKEGNQYRVTMDWLHSPRMELMATETFVVEGTVFAQGELQAEIEKSLDLLIKKIPFQGQVTGRDGKSVTLDVGTGSGIKIGDTVIISSLENAKRHPLTNIIVDWQLAQIGKIEIDQVEDSISFGHVIEEDLPKQMARYQKITQITSTPAPDSAVSEALLKGSESAKNDENEPHLGWVSGHLSLGNYSREETNSNGTGDSGGGFLLGAGFDGELWVNRKLFADLSFGYGSWNYNQKDLTGKDSPATAGGGVSGNASDVKFAIGYTYLVGNDYFGTKGWLKLGYHSISYSLPNSTAELTAPSSMSSVFLGIGGDLPIRSNWGALLNFDFGVFCSGKDNSVSTASANDFSLFLGGYYQYSQRMRFRVGFGFQANGAQLSNRNELSEKFIGFAPGLLYYF